MNYDNRLSSTRKIKVHLTECIATDGFDIIKELTQLKPAAGTLSHCYHNGIFLFHILSLIKYF